MGQSESLTFHLALGLIMDPNCLGLTVACYQSVLALNRGKSLIWSKRALSEDEQEPSSDKFAKGGEPYNVRVD